MSRSRERVDRTLLFLLLALIFGGALIFTSAAFGLLARGANNISSVAFNHLVLGLGLGLVALVVLSNIDYRKWRPVAPYIFLFALIATALVFIPGLGFEHGGGRRWIAILGTSFQPSEALKLASILLAATYFAVMQRELRSFVHGVGGLLSVLALPTLLLVRQPDIGTLGVIVLSTGAIYIAAGARWRHIAVIGIVIGALLSLYVTAKPYAKERVMTFFNPAVNQQDEGYQIKQSLIAIGSGGIFGRGFGQGLQKFTYLPEPMGDSIFAVAAEELGFIGSTGIVLLFLGFGLRGFFLAAHAPDVFGSLLAIGISTYLVSEAFINIAAMLALLPLTGIPLTFISQGGSAMLVALASAGILLNISKRRAT